MVTDKNTISFEKRSNDDLKWNRIVISCELFVDGRLKDTASESFAYSDLLRIKSGDCIASFEEHYFLNVYLIEWSETSVVIQMAGKDYSLNLGEEVSDIVVENYAYGKTSVALVNDDLLQKLQQEQEQERARQIAEAHHRAAEPRPQDELISQLETATYEQWSTMIREAWEKREVFNLGIGHMARIAKVCFLPSYGHVDISETARWASEALKLRSKFCCMLGDEILANLAFCNEVMTRISYARGLTDKGHGYYLDALRKDHSDLPKCWEVRYDINTNGEYTSEQITRLLQEKNFRALNMLLSLCGPDSKESLARFDETGETEQVWEICRQLYQIYLDPAPTTQGSLQYEPMSYVAFFLRLSSTVEEFWDDAASRILVEGAEAGNLYCQYYLGRVYQLDMEDEELPQEKSKLQQMALKYFHLAADQGHAAACRNYSELLETVDAADPDIIRYANFANRL